VLVEARSEAEAEAFDLQPAEFPEAAELPAAAVGSVQGGAEPGAARAPELVEEPGGRGPPTDQSDGPPSMR
jgi:hypothetical protein